METADRPQDTGPGDTRSPRPHFPERGKTHGAQHPDAVHLTCLACLIKRDDTAPADTMDRTEATLDRIETRQRGPGQFAPVVDEPIEDVLQQIYQEALDRIAPAVFPLPDGYRIVVTVEPLRTRS